MVDGDARCRTRLVYRPMSLLLDALRFSVGRLRTLVSELGDEELTAPAFPAEWSIADVLSHIGSSAVILQRRFDDALADRPTPDDFAPSVWERWNAKPARAKAADAMTADQTLLARLESCPVDERARFRVAMGPLTFDFTGFVRVRVNEHALHTWDIDVAADPGAVVPPELATLVVDNLGLIARYTARPAGSTGTITVHTTDPARQFTIEPASDGVRFTQGDVEGEADLALPAEAFVRLVYGRLDPGHTPAVEGDTDHLDELRRVFPGP